MTIKQVLEKHKNELMQKEGVLGVGRGELNGKPCITIFVQKGTSPTLPGKIDGFAVNRIESDEIRAL